MVEANSAGTACPIAHRREPGSDEPVWPISDCAWTMIAIRNCWLLVSLIAAGAGCGLHQEWQAPYDMPQAQLAQNPMYVPLSDREVLWNELINTVDDYFRIQREELYALLPHVRRCCIDSTGIGAQLAEEAREKFGSKVEEVTFTGAVKEDLAVTVRRKFEDRQVRIPPDRDIREDLHSVKKFTTAAGNIRFDSERTELGHADRFWALALAVHAASVPAGKLECIMGPPLRGASARGVLAGASPFEPGDIY